MLITLAFLRFCFSGQVPLKYIVSVMSFHGFPLPVVFTSLLPPLSSVAFAPSASLDLSGSTMQLASQAAEIKQTLEGPSQGSSLGPATLWSVCSLENSLDLLHSPYNAPNPDPDPKSPDPHSGVHPASSEIRSPE